MKSKVKAKRLKLIFDGATVEINHHPEIDSVDARNALKALYERSSRASKKPADRILDKMFIASAMTSAGRRAKSPRVSWKNGKGEIISNIPGDDFEKRWKRARKDGRRASSWDRVDLFILRNWRVMRPWVGLSAQCPGLIEWSPKAASALIFARLGEDVGMGESWYIKRRSRLGLRGKSNYRAHDFGTFTDGRAWVDLD